MNNVTTTGYFKRNRGTRQGDSLSTHMFALAIEISCFIMIRKKVDIKGLDLFGTEVKLTACPDDTIVFEKS